MCSSWNFKNGHRLSLKSFFTSHNPSTTQQKTFFVSNERYGQNKTFLLWCYGIDFAPIKWYHQFHSSWLYVKILPLWSLLTLYSNVCPSFCLSAIFLSFCLFDLLLIYLSQEALFVLLLVCLSLRTTSAYHQSILVYFSLVFPPNCQTVLLSVCSFLLSFLLYVYKLRKTFTIKWKI